jgi:hypothetical protein
MPYSEKVREIKRLQDEILKHHRPADIKRLDAILQEGPLEQKRADRERYNKALDEKPPKRICEHCQMPIEKDQVIREIMGKYWHAKQDDCPKKA